MHKALLCCLLFVTTSAAAFSVTSAEAPEAGPLLLAESTEEQGQGQAKEKKEALPHYLEKHVKKPNKRAVKPIEELIEKAENVLDDNQLEKSLDADLKRGGLFLGLISALTLLYDTVVDTLLYPTFVFLFFVMTCIVILLGVRLFLHYKREEVYRANSSLFWFFLVLLIYFDLFLVIYEKRKILFLFLELQKDTLLIALAALAGFIRGNFSSKRDFEEKVLP